MEMVFCCIFDYWLQLVLCPVRTCVEKQVKKTFSMFSIVSFFALFYLFVETETDFDIVF
jgi:hypothetical protein